MSFLSSINLKILAIFCCFAITTQPFRLYAEQVKPCRAIATPKSQPRIHSKSGEIKAIDLIWNGSISEDSGFEFPEIENLGLSYFAFFDLNNDGQEEVFIRSTGRSGSGGAAFIILEKQHGKWKQIASFLGGFVLNNGGYRGFNNRYYSITFWTRVGGEETYQTVLAYKNRKYQEVSSQLLPFSILYSKDFQKLVLDNNWMCWTYWN